MRVFEHVVPRFPGAGVCALAILIPGALPIRLQAQSTAIAAGKSRSVHDVTLRAEPRPSFSGAGRISTIRVREGDTVEKGQILVELDHQRESLEAERRKLVWESQVELESARSRVATLKDLLGSSKRLFETTQSISEEELKRKQLEYKLAVAEQRRLEIAEKREKIEYELAKESLEIRFVRAPFDGVVVKLFVDEGDSCQANQPLVHVVDARTIRVTFDVERSVGRSITSGQVLRVAFPGNAEDLIVPAKVVFVSPIVDPASGLMKVKAEVENRDGAVQPGVRARLVSGTDTR